MDALVPPKIVVLGLGNLIRSDDAVGLFALRHLEEDPRLPLHVSLVEGGTKGLELVPYICDASCLLVLDAVDVGAAPGTVLRIAGEDLRSLPGSGNVHGLALADILNALRMMGHQPPKIVLLGIQPLITELGTVLSTPLREALPALVEAAVTELCQWAPSDESSMCEVARAEESGVAIPVWEG
jgi:hydrogenase maturation protease